MAGTLSRAKLAVLALLGLLMLPNLLWLTNGLERAHWEEAFVIPILLLLFLFAAAGKRMWAACLALSPF